MTITIQGLTDRQRLLADLLWNTKSMEQHRTLLQSLEGQDRRDAVAIAEIMIQEFLWETLDDDYESQEVCAAAIARARSSV